MTRTLQAIIVSTSPGAADDWARALRGWGPATTVIGVRGLTASWEWRVASWPEQPPGADGAIFVTDVDADPARERSALARLAAELERRGVDPARVPAAVIVAGADGPTCPSLEELRARAAPLTQPILFRVDRLTGRALGGHPLVVTSPGPDGGGAAFTFDRSRLRGEQIRVRAPGELRLSTVAATKRILAEPEVLEVLVVDPLRAGDSRQLVIERAGVVIATERLTLDDRGVATLELVGLTAGPYRLHIAGESADAHEVLVLPPPTASPLRVALVDQVEEAGPSGGMFEARLFVEDQGEPLHGPATFTFRQGGRIVKRLAVTVEAGELWARFGLDDPSAPLVVDVSVDRDPATVVTVPLRGEAAREAAPGLAGVTSQVFESAPGLIDPVTAALRRRLERARPAPIEVTALRGDAVVVTRARVADLHVAVWDLVRNEVQERALLAPAVGHRIFVPIPDPLGIVTVAAWVDGEPFEAWTPCFTDRGVELFLAAKPTGAARLRGSIGTPLVRIAAEIATAIGIAGRSHPGATPRAAAPARDLIVRQSELPPVLERLTWRLESVSVVPRGA